MCGGVYVCTGGDVNAKDSDGRTPMHWAAMEGHLKVVHALREAGTWCPDTETQRHL